MNALQRLCIGLFALAWVSGTSLANADLAPPDQCTKAGDTCNNAGPSYNQPGTCISAKCTRATPDGSIEYECTRCVVSGAGGAGGAAGASGTAGSSATTAGTSSTQPVAAKEDDGGSCSIATESQPAWGALLLTLGVAAFGLSRRRR